MIGDIVQTSTYNASANATSHTSATLSATPKVWNTLLMFVVASSTITTPVGWTLETNAGITDTADMKHFRRHVSPFENTSWIVSLAASRVCSIYVIEVEGVLTYDSSSATKIDTTASHTTETTNNITHTRPKLFYAGMMSPQLSGAAGTYTAGLFMPASVNIRPTGGTNRYQAGIMAGQMQIGETGSPGLINQQATCSNASSRSINTLVGYRINGWVSQQRYMR